jgi:hypothetical protein
VPTLAVVVPTRNRADLALRAARSVLAQDPAQAVLVSDNSTDEREREALQTGCQGLGEAVSHVRPPEPLPMAAHWEWARRQAFEDGNVTHVTYLTDRMVLLPGALTALRAVAGEHPTLAISYHHDVIEDDRRPIRVLRHPWTGKLAEARSDHLIALVRRGQLAAPVPRMLNTLAPRALLEDIESRFGSVFDSVAPDFCFAFRALVSTETTLWWDRSWLVQSGLDRSNGAAQARGIASPDSRDFDANLGGRSYASATPLPDVLTPGNAAFNEYFAVAAETEDQRLGPIEPAGYLGRLAEDVARLENPELRERFSAQLAGAGWGPRLRGRLWRRRLATLARFALERPGAWRGLPGSFRYGDTAPTFETSEAALAWRLSNPREADRLTGELRALLEDRRTELLRAPAPATPITPPLATTPPSA